VTFDLDIDKIKDCEIVSSTWPNLRVLFAEPIMTIVSFSEPHSILHCEVSFTSDDSAVGSSKVSVNEVLYIHKFILCSAAGPFRPFALALNLVRLGGANS
jgi:hypothetical protein